MLNTFAIILPVFLLIGLGYLAIKTGLVESAAIPSISKLVLFFCLPATVFASISRVHFSEVIEPYFLLAYGLASFSMLVLGFSARRLLSGDGNGASAIKALGMSLPNSMFIGYPILVLTFAEPPAVAFVMALLVENILIMPLALVMLEYAAGQGAGGAGNIWRIIALRTFKNPLMLAILAGVLASLTGLEPPKPISQGIDLLSRASAALALLFIGLSLASNTIRGKPEGAISVVFGKLIAHPLLATLFIWLLPPFDPVLQKSIIIITAVPMMAIYPIIGERYGHRSFCASALLMATVAGFVTLALVLGLVSLIPASGI